MSSRDYCAHWWEHCRCRTTRRKGTVDHRWAPIHHRLSSTRPTWRPTLWYHRRRPATETKKRRRRRRPKSWNFCRPSFQAIISPGHEIFSPPQRDENIHFPLEKEKKISTTRIARVQNLGYYTQRGQSGFLLCTSIRAHVFSASVAICKANQTCPNDTDLSQVFSRNKGLAKKRISAREERVFETKAKRKV